MNYDVRRSRVRASLLRISASGELVVNRAWRFDLRILPDVCSDAPVTSAPRPSCRCRRQRDTLKQAAVLPRRFTSLRTVILQ
jgi:hypothetical protein